MTTIEWTDQSWNPIVGCTITSPGCTNCYAMSMAARLERMNPDLDHYAGLTKVVNGKPVWSGKVAMAPDRKLTEPLRRRKPTMYFVNSMGDLFHPDVPDEWIDRVFAVMALAPQHKFQVLTKQSARMRGYMTGDSATLRDRWYRAVPAGRWPVSVAEAYAGIHPHCSEETRAMYYRAAPRWPLRNVWLGVSAEDQKRADERIPNLLATPAAVRFVSAEPLLSKIDFSGYLWGRANGNTCTDCPRDCDCECGAEPRHKLPGEPALSWVIVGGESGPGARPMHPDWARSIRDQCAAAGVSFFFKQWGEWIDWRQFGATAWKNTTPQRNSYKGPCVGTFHGGEQHFCGPFETRHAENLILARKGKKLAGRLLDGVEHNAMPEVR